MIEKLPPPRVGAAKRAFTTRRVPLADMQTLISGGVRPVSGDLVLASVQEIGKQRKIEQPSGRRAQLVVGDEIIVAYGSRYAPDQYEAIISEDLGLCDLIAAGGMASREVNRHDKMLPPTKIMPVGLIGDEHGERLNLSRYRVSDEPCDKPIKVIVVVGTAMNSGKTFTAASLIYSLKSTPYRVAGIKATGTGSGGDVFLFKDLGADVALDFTDGGFSGTYLIPDEEIERMVLSLINHAARLHADVAIVEIADGLRHRETATLLRSPRLRERASGVVLAAYDSMGAKAGVDLLQEWGYDPMAISGQLTRSPLMIREASRLIDCDILTPFQIQAGALREKIMNGQAANDRHVFAKMNGTAPSENVAPLQNIVHMPKPGQFYPIAIPEIDGSYSYGLHDHEHDFFDLEGQATRY
jgi:hypothetical protein